MEKFREVAKVSHFSIKNRSKPDPKGDQTNRVVEDIFGNDLDSFKGYGVDIVQI